MLFTETKSVENIVVLVLTNHSQLSANQILNIIKKKKLIESITLQGVYRVLRKLENEGVVVKNKKTYSLQISWILDISTYLDQMERTYLQEKYLSTLLPTKNNSKKQWHFTNLLKAADFWGQILLAMAKTNPNSIALSYSPFLWYELLMTEKDHQFLKVYHKIIKKEYVIIGNRNQLDKNNIKAIKTSKDECYFSLPDERPIKHPGTYVDVIKDLVLTVTLDKKTMENLKSLYNMVHAESVNHEHILTFLTAPVRVKMTVKNDRRYSQLLHKKFEKIFGPLNNNH